MECLTVIEMELKIVFGNFFSKYAAILQSVGEKILYFFLFLQISVAARGDLDSFCSLSISG